MKVKFVAPTISSNGLRLISDIPDVRLAKLEGKNGIGKTLAARLLELVSGSQPYAALPRAWESLVDLLGTVRIEIEGLRPGTAVIDLDSSEWRNRSQAECAANPGKVTLAEREISWEEFRKLLQVRRIAGDEGLAETLGLTLRERATVAEEERLRVGAQVDQWSHRLETLAELQSNISSEALIEFQARLDRSKRKIKTLVETRLLASQQAESWALTQDLLQQALQCAQKGPALLRAYEAAFSEYEEARARVDQLERNLTSVAVASIQDGARRKEISRWSRLLELRRAAFVRAQLEEKQFLNFLAIEFRPDEHAVLRLRKETTDQIEAAEASIRTGHLAGTIRQAAENIEHGLIELPPEAHSEVVAELDRPVTVGQLLSGVRRRSEALQGVPKPASVAKLERE